ncbi:MAG: methionine--tRNA ligase [Candidatus Altiarchaeales archaeon ex4484_96]|nr:MAG: methionine--tRNA ligase [Candidatus Altiarchaeales archaeon ex4484_96]
MSKQERILVTSALPYANGPLHIGHAIGAYIPADVYTRYHRAKGTDIIYICGTDEHGTPITVTADNENTTPQKIVDKYHKQIKQTFAKLNISFDYFSRTTNKTHHKLSQEIFLEIKNKNLLYQKTVNRPYCPSCKKFLPDRYVKGTCPQCGETDQRGDQCEACGKQLEPHELKESYCILCHKPPVMKETIHWFFKLTEYEKPLRKWIEGNTHWPDNARNFSLGWLREGLKDRAITRDLSWGIPVPVAGSEDKVLYVWFDAPIGYISSTIEWAQKKGDINLWKKYWKQKNTKIIHFIGKDNIPFHAIIWPAILMAEGSLNLPHQISSNEYLNLEGKKMSTSRGWVIWLHEILDKWPTDYLRYYLLCINPAKHDTDFSLTDYKHHINHELISTLGNFIHRTLTFIKQNNKGIIPEPGVLDETDNKAVKAIEDAVNNTAAYIEDYRFSQALQSMMALAHEGNSYFQHKEPWANENNTTLYVCANMVGALSIIMEPFLPASAQNIRRMLNLKKEMKWDDAKEINLEGGHVLGEINPLYDKIEDVEINEFKKNHLKTDKEDKKMSNIGFEDFKAMDLRIAQIVDVQDHPNADKLYLLTVSLGEQTRQLVAGLKTDYSKKDLINRQVVVVANLKPAKIRGKKSEGMILAADVDGKPILLQPDKKTSLGARVR